MTLLALLAAAAVAGTGCAPAPALPVRQVATTRSGPIGYQATIKAYGAGTPTGSVTALSYVRPSTQTKTTPPRPILFAFNGGPGSSSIYLNVGLLGPLRVEIPAPREALDKAVLPIVANPDSPLDVADIVLIDPPGTGCSAPPSDTDARVLYSVNGDARAVAAAIDAWVDEHHRSASPVYILGESYGAQRAVDVAADLVKRDGWAKRLHGIVLLSQSIQVLDTVQRRSNVVGQAVGLPTLAATAWYYRRAGHGDSLETVIAKAQRFARERYLPALYAGSALPIEERNSIARELSSLTGVPSTYFEAHDLYLSKDEFRHELLRSEGRVLGTYDTRYTSDASETDGADAVTDALESAGRKIVQRLVGIDGATYKPYSDLNWSYLDEPLVPFMGSTYLPLDYSNRLQRLMAAVPGLQVLIAGGYYDTAASVGADEYLISRPELDRRRISVRHYPAGHMFYTDPQSRLSFSKELRKLMTGDNFE